MILKLFTKICIFFNCAILIMLVAGCVSPEPESYRISRYRPDVASITAVENVVVSDKSASNVVEVSVVATKPSDDNISDSGTDQDVVSADLRKHTKLRTLKKGDNIIIHLRSIPAPEEIKEVVDGWGEITLPHLGELKIAGKSVSEAERLIESSYIDGGIFKKINAIVVAEDEVYFVRGEVNRRGKFSLSGDITLLQAISEAGDFSPFANKKKIKVMRGDEILMYSVKDITKGKVPDPPIYSDDIIEVLKRVIW